MRKAKVPFPAFKGPVAAPAYAFGLDFLIFESGPPELFATEGDAAIVDVCGPLMQHAVGFYPSYDVIRKAALAAFASEAKCVVLRIDSPGGDFAGSLELGRSLREMSRAAGKPLYAFTDSMALSAAYAIACAADEIVITPSAFVGSVGVWAPLCDETARDKASGLNIAIVASGVSKADRNSHVPMTEEAVARLQAEVDAMADLFFSAVSDLRGMPRAQVVALQGAQEFGESAHTTGLADRIVNSWADFMSSTSQTEGSNAMAKFSMKEAKAGYRATLAKGAAEDSDDGKAAAAALAEFDKEEEKSAKKAESEKEAAKADADGDSDGDKPEPKKEAKAEGEEKKPEAKAAAEEPKKEEGKAAASGPTTVDLAKELHSLKAQMAADKEAGERAKLLASRPDFSAEVRATLAAAPIATLKKAVETWPKIGNVHEVNAGALSATGTQGGELGGQGGDYVIRETVGEYIDRKLGMGSPRHRGIVNEGTEVSLGFMTHEEAEAFLAKKEGK